MAKKERSYNPAQEQHKKDKKRAAEKIKQQRQNVQLSHASKRNPARLESQITNLKQLEAQGRLSDADRAVLSTLEKELRTVRKAKAQFSQQSGPVIVSDRTKMDEAEKAKLREKEERKQFRDILKHKKDPRKSVYYDEVWNPYGVPPPGMPWRERDEDDSEGWSTDSEVRRIPMPRDTPPAEKRVNPPALKPVVRREPTPEPIRPKPREKSPTPPAQQGPSATIEEAFLRAGATVIEAAPVLRDFQKEAATFVPSVVKRRPPPSKKPQRKENEVPKIEESKAFNTIVEDVNEDEGEGITIRGSGGHEKRSAERSPERSVEAPLKRSLQDEEEETPSLSQPSLAGAGAGAPTPAPAPIAPTAPPKRRRLVNAAPDV